MTGTSVLGTAVPIVLAPARVLDQGADVLVAQGGEGGGHGTRRRSTTAQFRRGTARDDPDTILVTAGEAVGLFHRAESAGTVVRVMAAEAHAALDAVHDVAV